MQLSPTLPILYSFRRCPYAMRARMTMRLCGIEWEHREVVLKAKPEALLSISPKGQVPVLQTAEGKTLEESLDIMHWAVAMDDPQDLIKGLTAEQQSATTSLIKQNDQDFKHHLDGYKYAQPEKNDQAHQTMMRHREACAEMLQALDQTLKLSAYLIGNQLRLVDIAIFPFIRQFRGVDSAWFDDQPWPHLQAWLAQLVDSDAFKQVMIKQRQRKNQ